MFRRALALLLMLTTFWSSGVQAFDLGGSGGAEHALLHWTDAGHHHHDDHSDDGYHVDDSSASAQHTLADQAFGAPALISGMPLTQPHGEPAIPRERWTSHHPAPFLDGPLRPPRTIS